LLIGLSSHSIEGTCRDHLARANEMAADANFGYALHGHALMLSNTPFNQEANAAAGHPNVPEIPASETPTDFLLRLLHMAKNLPLKGELPPIVALERIREDDRFPLMTMRDFENLVDDLKSRTKCYGYVFHFQSFFQLCPDAKPSQQVAARSFRSFF